MNLDACQEIPPAPVEDAALKERQKYEGIYSTPKQYGFYGHCNNGARAMAIVEKWQGQSLLDVGCGYNEFVISARRHIPGIRATGVDFACPGADVRACATSLPFDQKSFDVLTAFDMLEHVLPEQVDAVLREFARVSHRFIFAICHRASVITWQGQNLHPTVESEEWWMRRIIQAGGRGLAKQGRFITGHWTSDQAPPQQSKKGMIVVGNGSSLLDRRDGPLIDSFAEVLRFNAYKIDGYADFVGTKTSIWFNVIPFANKEHPLIQRAYDSVYLHSWEWDKAKCKLWQELAPRLRSPVSKVERSTILEIQEFAEDREYFAYSTGMIAVWLMLQTRGFVTLTGFDWWDREKHHYSDNAVRGTLHRPQKERMVFEKLQAQGRLAFLQQERDVPAAAE